MNSSLISIWKGKCKGFYWEIYDLNEIDFRRIIRKSMGFHWKTKKVFGKIADVDRADLENSRKVKLTLTPIWKRKGNHIIKKINDFKVFIFINFKVLLILQALFYDSSNTIQSQIKIPYLF